MDYMKYATMKDYSSWDLNCKYVNNDQKLEKRFKRKARRQLKKELNRTLNH